MKIDQLRQMVELAKTRSMNQAAANLFISQPNLSVSIRSLEQELGSSLVVRSNRGISLTTQGERFVEYAESLLSQFDRLKAICQPYGDGNSVSFSLANMRFRYVVDAASILYNRYKSNPFNLILRESDRDGVLDLVARGDCEIGVINILSCYKKNILKQIKAKDVQYYRLASNPASIVVGKNHPLYHTDPDTVLTIDMLAEYPQARYEEMDFSHYSDKGRYLGIPRTAGEIVVDSRSAMFEILENTNAFTIASTNHSAYNHAHYYPTARSFSLSDSTLQCEVGWLKRTSGVPSALALEFIQLLSGYFD